MKREPKDLVGPHMLSPPQKNMFFFCFPIKTDHDLGCFVRTVGRYMEILILAIQIFPTFGGNFLVEHSLAQLGHQ